MTDPIATTSPQKLLTFSSGGWVLLLAFLLTLVAAGIVLFPVYQTGFRSAVGDGQHLESYQFNLSNALVPLDQLIPSGKAKDAVRAVPESLVEGLSVSEITLMNKNEYAPFLVGSDLVIGVSVNGQSRAYPVRLMNLHEIVNDRLGKTPIAVTWAPLTGSAVVFERPTDAGATEFGVSGLVYNSNLLMFDRHSDPQQESLWSQLKFQAIAGPAAGKTLTVLPFELTTWKAWSTAHPDTLAFRGLRSLKQSYTDAQDPFSMYLATDEVRFPFNPRWPHAHPLLKTPVTLTAEGDTHWVASLGTTQPEGRHVYAFLFAWYAQHPDDTDYSAIGGR